MWRGGCELFRKEIGFTCSIRYGSGICNTCINGWSVSFGIANGQHRKARKENEFPFILLKYIDCTIIYQEFIVCLLEGCNGFPDKVCMAKCKENTFQSFHLFVNIIYKIHFRLYIGYMYVQNVIRDIFCLCPRVWLSIQGKPNLFAVLLLFYFWIVFAYSYFFTSL